MGSREFDVPGLPHVEFDFGIVDGQEECIGLHLTGRPITTGDLRNPELPKLMREAAADVHAELAEEAGREPVSRSQDERLTEVARVYTDAIHRGDRAPVIAVAEHFTKLLGREVTQKTASNWVAQARRTNPPKLPRTRKGAAHA